MIENAARLGQVMRTEMDRLQAKHPSVREGRCIGLFGMIDVQKNAQGERMAPYNGSHPAVKDLGEFFRDNGLFTLVRWGSIMCNPPLCITKEQLLEASKSSIGLWRSPTRFSKANSPFRIRLDREGW